jgi:hypothetical protein
MVQRIGLSIGILALILLGCLMGMACRGQEGRGTRAPALKLRVISCPPVRPLPTEEPKIVVEAPVQTVSFLSRIR